jgi:hypothetical protein
VDRLRKGGGKFVAFVHFASKRKRWRLIYFPIVAIPKGYEIWSRTGLAYPHTHEWATNISIETWWLNVSCKASPNRKALASITMLVSWTIWKKRNTRVFKNKAAPTSVLLKTIKNDARLWIAAGAKHLSVVLLEG